MTTPYAGDETNNPSSFDLPDDGDTKDVASILPAIEGIIDKLAHINFPEQDPAEVYPLATRTETRIVDIPGDFQEAEWSQVNGRDFWQVIGSSQVAWVQKIRLPKGSFLNTLTVHVAPGAGHVDVPATPPTVEIREVDAETGSTTLLAGPVTDPTSGVLVTYVVTHPIPLNFGAGISGIAIDRETKRYVAIVRTEGGANATAGFQINGFEYTYTVVAQDPGAS